MDDKKQAIATASAELAATCQEAVGPDEQVRWATVGYEGKNPVTRVLSLLGGVPALVLIPITGPVIAIVAMVVLSIAVMLTVTKVAWKPRIVAFTDQGVVILERTGRSTPGEVVGRLPDAEPTQAKDVWRGCEVGGTTTWITKLALDANTAPAPSEAATA
ncbi:hypothetical protein [Aquihabitans sp. McL0605]|uniref:hypothetical protein n=1 Tax=Aquihabitans sp. McL0605 TaxID=3415671 RepID=UPI003CEEE991